MFSYENKNFYLELENEKNSFCLRMRSCGFHGRVMRFNKRGIVFKREEFRKPEQALCKQQDTAVHQGCHV
jgi:hypothetical protein